jgi:hypothetical protein
VFKMASTIYLPPSTIPFEATLVMAFNPWDTSIYRPLVPFQI